MARLPSQRPGNDTVTETGLRIIRIACSQLHRHPKPPPLAPLPRLAPTAPTTAPTAPPPAPLQRLPLKSPCAAAQIPLRRRSSACRSNPPSLLSLPARLAPPAPSKNTALSVRTRGGVGGGRCAVRTPPSPLPMHQSSPSGSLACEAACNRQGKGARRKDLRAGKQGLCASRPFSFLFVLCGNISLDFVFPPLGAALKCSSAE